VVDTVTLEVVGVVFIATLIRSAFGFGEALVAVPLLAMLIPLQVAAPLAVLVSITIASVVVLQDWRQIHWQSAGWLLAATLGGIPAGLMLLRSSHKEGVKIALALVIILFSIYALMGRAVMGRGLPRISGKGRRWMLGFGFCAGVLGGAFGMNGPPLVIYGAMRRWTAQQFRATLQGYFLPASLVGLAGYWLVGLWVAQVTHLYLVCLPVLLPAIWLGRVVNHRLHGDAFLRYVYFGLLGIGTTLLWHAVRGG
jgi:hypothetical protein